MTDSIEQPAHYNFGTMEAREIIELAIADFRDPATIYHVASALKYLLRASRKNGSQDIAKARKHIVWAEAAALARRFRNNPPPDYDTADVAFRHGDIDKVCASGEFAHSHRTIWDRDPSEPGAKIVRQYTAGFTQPPNCDGVHESIKSNELGNVETVDGAHPMHAEALRVEDEKPRAVQARRMGESEWSVTWPWDVPRPCEKSAAPQTTYQTLVGN